MADIEVRNIRREAFRGDFEGGMSTLAARKDSSLALEMARDANTPLFVMGAADTLYEVALAHALGNQDYASIITLWDTWRPCPLEDVLELLADTAGVPNELLLGDHEAFERPQAMGNDLLKRLERAAGHRMKTLEVMVAAQEAYPVHISITNIHHAPRACQVPRCPWLCGPVRRLVTTERTVQQQSIGRPGWSL